MCFTTYNVLGIIHLASQTRAVFWIAFKNGYELVAAGFFLLLSKSTRYVASFVLECISQFTFSLLIFTKQFWHFLANILKVLF